VKWAPGREPLQSLIFLRSTTTSLAAAEGARCRTISTRQSAAQPRRRAAGGKGAESWVEPHRHDAHLRIGYAAARSALGSRQRVPRGRAAGGRGVGASPLHYRGAGQGSAPEVGGGGRVSRCALSAPRGGFGRALR
jgi:hypothetical protein